MVKQEYKQTVSALVLNSENQVLLTHNKSHGADFWKMPQGGVEQGESHDQAILREMSEELSSKSFDVLKKADIKYKYDWPENVQETKGFVGPELTFFILRCTDVESLSPDEEELDAIKWVELDELEDAFNSLPEFKSTIQALVKEAKTLVS